MEHYVRYWVLLRPTTAGRTRRFRAILLIQPVLHVADEGIHLTVGKEFNPDQPDVLIFINHNALPCHSAFPASALSMRHPAAGHPLWLKEHLPVSVVRMARQYHDEIRHKPAHAAELREFKAR